MSTVKANNYYDASGGSNAQLYGVASPPNSMGFRNRILNGDMRIDQRNAGASVTVTNTSASTYLLDRWKADVSQASKMSVQQSSVAPTGFTNSLLVTSLSAYTVGASEVFAITQIVEGFNIADFAWGSASAQSVTLSFWVRSSLTGTFGVVLENSANNRSYPATYTISAANTWEQKSITIAGDTTGTWVVNSGKGVQVKFGLGVGSTLSGTVGSWAAADYWGATGATSVVATNGATFYITGVQLEAGTNASPFERRDYGRELMMCQRYYQKYASESAYCVFVGAALASGATAASGSTQLVTTMRATPSLSSSGSMQLSDGVSAYAVTAVSIAGNQSATRVAQINFTAGGGGLTTYRNYRVEANNNTTAFIDFSAEL